MAMSMTPDTSSEKYRSGFDCQFVDAPKELQSECPVCLSILREPCQVTCCGKSFCRACIAGFEFALDGMLNVPASGVKYRKPTVALRK